MTEPIEVVARFTKSVPCPTIYPDGAWGSLTAQGNIYMALFTQSPELPSITIQIDPETHRPLGPEQPVLTTGIVREIQAAVILSPGVALVIRDWLDRQITQAQQAQAEIEQLRGQSLNQKGQQS